MSPFLCRRKFNGEQIAHNFKRAMQLVAPFFCHWTFNSNFIPYRISYNWSGASFIAAIISYEIFVLKIKCDINKLWQCIGQLFINESNVCLWSSRMNNCILQMSVTDIWKLVLTSYTLLPKLLHGFDTATIIVFYNLAG